MVSCAANSRVGQFSCNNGQVRCPSDRKHGDTTCNATPSTCLLEGPQTQSDGGTKTTNAGMHCSCMVCQLHDILALLVDV